MRRNYKYEKSSHRSYKRRRSRSRSPRTTKPPPAKPVEETPQEFVPRRPRISNFDRVDRPAQLEQIKSQPKVDNSAINPELLQQAMRLYVGNLPATTSEELSEFFNKIMIHYGGIIEAGSPIVNVTILNNTYAFIEFRSVEETDTALTLNGIVFNNRVLEIRRPANYYSYNLDTLIKVQAPRINLDKVGLISNHVEDGMGKVFIGGIPLSMTEDQIREIVTCYGKLKSLRLEAEEVEKSSNGYAFWEFVEADDAERWALALNGCIIRDRAIVARRVVNPEFERELVETSLGIFQGSGPDFSLLTQYPGGVIQPSFDTIVHHNRPITVAEFIRLKQTLETLQNRSKEQAQLRAQREADIFASRVGPPGMEFDHRMYEDIPGLNGIPGVTANLFPALNFSIHPEGATNILRIEKMVTKEHLFVLAEFTKIFNSIMQDCSLYGTVTSLVIPREEDGYSGACIGVVYVSFLDTSAAVRACNMLKQKLWNGENLEPEFYDKAKFKRNELE